MGLIRILLALFVVLYHCGQFENFRMMQGTHAVQSFYIISGFYMALILNEKYVSQIDAYMLFITNRLLKLLPVYWLIVLLIFIISCTSIFISHGNEWAFLRPFKSQSLSFCTWVYLFFSNIFILGQDLSLFMGLNSGSGSLYFTSFYEHSTPPLYSFMLVPQAWTISIEIMFYLIAPFIVRKRIWKIALYTLVAAVIKFLLFRKGFNYDPWSYRFFPAEMFFFLLGVLAYKLYCSTKEVFIPKWFMIASFVATLLVIISFEVLLLQFHQYLYFVSFSLAIPVIFRLTKKSKIDRIIGEYSYPIYISHVFFKGLYFILFGYSPNVSIPVIVMSILFAYFYNEVYNKKFENYRQSRVILSKFKYK